MKLVLICGAGHTGSSILARILGEHSKILFPKSETNLFLLYNHFKLEKNIKKIKKKLKNKKKKIYLEKTNRHLTHINFIRQKFHNVKIILTTRNGRDVIGSYYKRYKDLNKSIIRYRDESIQTIREVRKKNVILVRYEDFILNPKKTAKKIYKFIGINYEEEIFDYHKKEIVWNHTIKKLTNGTGEKNHDYLRSYQVNSKLFDGRNSWKKNVPKKYWKQINKFFSKMGKDIQKELGY